MFQNINVEYENEEIKENTKSRQKSYFIQLFSIQNILLYIVTLGVSMVGFGEKIAPFGIAIFVAVCSNKIPAGMVYILAGVGSFISNR